MLTSEHYEEIKMMRGQKHYHYLCQEYFDFIEDHDKRVFGFWICFLLLSVVM